MSTDIEKKSLEAHVELCAERYSALENKLDSLEKKVLTLEQHILFIRESIASANERMNKQLITIGTTIVGALVSGVIVLLINLNK
jgi:predicted  nucleic acid-binding Zn-ribbon protein